MKQVEEIKHAHRLELANVKMEFLKARGEVERERDKLQTQVESKFLHLLPFPFLAVSHSLPLFSRPVVFKVGAARGRPGGLNNLV